MKNGKGNNQQKGGGGQGTGRGTGGRGRGAMDGTRPGSGPGGSCKCPDCGTVAEHKPGVPCYQERCPNCGQPMVRD